MELLAYWPFLFPKRSLGFFVWSVLAATPTELLQLQPFLAGAAVLGGVVVMFFADGALEGDHRPDVFGHLKRR